MQTVPMSRRPSVASWLVLCAFVGVGMAPAARGQVAAPPQQARPTPAVGAPAAAGLPAAGSPAADQAAGNRIVEVRIGLDPGDARKVQTLTGLKVIGRLEA